MIMEDEKTLKNAMNETDHVSGTIILHVRLLDRRVCVLFDVVENRIVPVLPDTSFIDRFISWIFPAKRQMFPYNYVPNLKVQFLKKDEKQEEDEETNLLMIFDAAEVSKQMGRVSREARLAP